jgi:hypothetical protein
MFNIRWSTIAYLISATVSTGVLVEAKDEHRRAEHKAPPKIEHRATPAAPALGNNKHAQPPHHAPAKVNPPQNTQPVHRPRVDLPNHAPKAVHNIQLMQNGQNNRPQVERHKLQLPQAAPKVLLTQKDSNPPRKPDLPKVDSKIQLPQINKNPNGPRHQEDRNKLPQHQPKLNPPNNTLPGPAPGNPSIPNVQPKHNLPQHGHRGGDNPANGVGQPNLGNKLPQFNPNAGNNNPNLPKLDSKHVLENRRDNKPPGGLNLNPQVPGNGGLKLDANRGEPGHHFNREHLPMKVDTPIDGTQKHAIPLQIPKNGNLHFDRKNDGPDRHSEQLQSLMHAKDHHDFERKFDQFKHSPDFTKQMQLAHLNPNKISGLHQDRLVHGDGFKHWQNTNVGHQLNLERQFQLQRHGDLTRQMNFSANVINSGGWQHRHHGAVAAAFTAGSFSVWYAGGGCYPTHCWYPRWSPWVSWSWWDTCRPFYDPRPNYCRPIVYQPCQPWVYYQYPVWQPLPVATCGTWVDVEPVVIQAASMDLQMLAVRFVDNGHPEQNLGPRFRVWVRNNSQIQITSPFSVLALASNDTNADASLPQAGVVIPSMDIGEVRPVDIRLPLQANRMGVTPEGHKVPFSFLQVLVDSHQQVGEVNEANNGAVVARTEILPVDPAAFSSDLTAAAPGATLTIAGEGFGPEPGRVLVSVNGQQTEALIQGWYDLGVRFTVPNYTLTGVVDADILVVRGDGAVSNPLDVDLGPASMIGQPLDIPGAPVPDSPQ